MDYYFSIKKKLYYNRHWIVESYIFIVLDLSNLFYSLY